MLFYIDAATATSHLPGPPGEVLTISDAADFTAAMAARSNWFTENHRPRFVKSTRQCATGRAGYQLRPAEARCERAAMETTMKQWFEQLPIGGKLTLLASLVSNAWRC